MPLETISTNLKELLTRFAAGEIEELPSTIVTPEIDIIVQDVYKCRQELKKVNVLPSLAKIHPNYIHSTVDDSISNDDLIFVVENEHVKNSLLEFDLKLTEALMRQQDNPLFNWQEFAESLINILKPKNKNDFIYLDQVNFDQERVIASWGFPTLDSWLEGGITESSFNVFYAPTNCISADSFINYYVATKDTKRLFDKRGGTIERLYERFHNNVLIQRKGNYIRSVNLNNVEFFTKSYNPISNRIEKQKIINVVKSGLKKVYKVTLANGNSLKTTLEHKFITRDLSYKPLADLAVGSLVGFDFGRKSESVFKRKHKEIFVKNHPSAGSKIVNGCKYFRVRLENFIVEANENGMSFEDYRDFLNDSNKYNSNIYSIPKGYEVHHLDGDHENNDISNLLVMLRKDHLALHLQDRVTWSLPKLGFSEIVSIVECGEEETYDLQVENTHNYIANGICVHNCGKTTAVTVTQSASLIRQGKIPLIISLEGSPQKLALKILANLAGFADVDPLDFSEIQKEIILNLAKCMPHIPIISRDCNKRWQLDRYIQKFKPDVIIYDQITISGKGLGWEAMAGMSNLLKTLAQSTGIPVIALSQSSEQNYNGASNNKETDLRTEHKIKYSEALIHDATNVIEITKHQPNTAKRSFTVRKTKDDFYSKQIPLRLVCELTSAGYVERYALDAWGTNIPLAPQRDGRENRESKIENPVVEERVIEKIEKVAPPILIENTELLTEIGNLPDMPESTGLFSQEVWEGIPDRIQEIIKYLPNQEEPFKRIIDVFNLSREKGYSPLYSQEGIDSYLITHTDFIHDEFKPYFYKGRVSDD